MLHGATPQPFQRRAQDALWRRILWVFPGILAVIFVLLVVVWAEFNQKNERTAFEQTLLADAASVEAQLVGRQDMERAKLREVARKLPDAVAGSSLNLAAMPDVVAGMDRLWNWLVWLDGNNRVVARAERKKPMEILASDDLHVQADGLAYHLVEPVLDAAGNPVGQLLARYAIGDLLRSTDLAWLNRRYEVSFVSELGEIIATTAIPGREPRGVMHERPLMAFKDASLRLTPYEAPVSWRESSSTVLLLLGMLMLGLGASHGLRKEMRQVSRAVTEAQTEAAWRQSMEDSALVGLRARDAHGRILYVNKTLCEMVGFAREELVGLMPPLPFWPTDTLHALLARNTNTLAGDAPSAGFETRWRHRDGHYLDVMIFESRLVNSEGVHIGWMGSIIDISERKRLEERDRQHTDTLAQHARLNDMGILASELAHELNQPLTTIVSYSAGLEIAMKRQPALDADLMVAIEEVNRHARKAGDIVNWIRKQTSRSAVDRENRDINGIVSEVLGSRMVQRQCAYVRLVTSLASGLPWVTVDTIGIEQVMTNLIRNAADALKMKTGEKTITLSTQLHRRRPDGEEEILVGVVDNGAGLQGRTIDVLCSAFYSTKQGGMGLGLGICRSIIEAHHGTFTAEEAQGGGAAFFFTLPTSALAFQAGDL